MMIHEIVDIVGWVLVVFGIAMTISKSKLVQPYRTYIQRKSHFLKDLVNCPMCLSFWIGMLSHFVWTSPTGNAFLDGFLAVGATWILYSLVWNWAVKNKDF